MSVRSPRCARAGERGYNLVVLVMAITVLNILVAAALPLWSTMIQREKEEELIFRGLQYAEAIRVFHNRFQRYPNRLEELVEVEPRSIRQLWKDPMTDSGKWKLIFQGQPDPVTPKKPDPDADADEEGGEEEETFGVPKGEVAVGPITGVRSRSSKESILVFFGKERYDEWQFTEDMILQAMTGRQKVGGDMGAEAGLPSVTTRWVGRPLPSFLNLPNGMPPNGSLPGGMGGPGGLPPNPRGNPSQGSGRKPPPPGNS